MMESNRRLLYDTQSLTTDKLEAIEKASKKDMII
jgi:sulfate adenylyltransferase subunit 1 (EFTu-like GTPase family)